MFELPPNLKKEEAPKVESWQIGTAKATYLDIRGTYLQLPRPLAYQKPGRVEAGLSHCWRSIWRRRTINFSFA